MSFTRTSQKKIDAILVDAKAGMGVIDLQAKHRISLPTMYKIPVIKEAFQDRAKHKIEARWILIQKVVKMARKGKLQREIAKELGINLVTVRDYGRKGDSELWKSKRSITMVNYPRLKHVGFPSRDDV